MTLLRVPLRWPSDSANWHRVHSPNDGLPLGEFQRLDARDQELVVSRVQEGQRELARHPAHVRAGWLRATAQALRDDQEAVANLIASEGGKPLKDARVEATRAAQTLELCAEEAVRLGGEVLPMERTAAGAGHLAFTRHEPIGPVLALSAFNHPMNLLAHQVGTALAAGCAVAFKPASDTPFCAEWLADTLAAKGVPLEAAVLFHADPRDAEKLAAHSAFKYVSFVGSAAVGWELRRKIAPGTRIALEHGGQAPAIVWDDADLDAAVKALTKGGFYHAGQVCISTQNIHVHERVFDAFVERLRGAVEALVVGDARDAATDVGPLIRAKEKNRVEEWVAEAMDAGARVIVRRTNSGANLMGPVVLTHVPTQCRIWKEEVFGPVVNVNPFRDVAEVYRSLEANPYQFEAAIFTTSLPRALEAMKLMPAMTVVVNNHTAVRVDEMPFGGHGLSGHGMGGVRWAVQEQTRLKQVLINGF